MENIKVTGQQKIAAEAPVAANPLARTVMQDPAGHPLRIVFGAHELPGRPDVFEVAGKTFPVRPSVGPGPAPKGAQGGQLSYVVEIPAWSLDGSYDAKIRVKNEWIAVPLRVVTPAICPILP
jgi:hypothetical protein